MTAPIGPGDWLICVDGADDSFGDSLALGSLYQISELDTSSYACVRCGGSLGGVRVHTDRYFNGFWCLDRFRPAGRGGMFNSLLTAKPVRVGEDA